MRSFHVVFFLLAVSAVPALAQRAPVIVIPGKPGVPVYINGIDASWAVVEGEFGLDRPGAMTPIVTYRPIVLSIPYRVPGYHPRDGRRPGYGRFEIVPPPDRVLPPPAPTYYRSWSSESAPGQVTEHPPFNPPHIVVEPRFGRDRVSSNPRSSSPTHKRP
jgi:hypothetical protein